MCTSYITICQCVDRTLTLIILPLWCSDKASLIPQLRSPYCTPVFDIRTIYIQFGFPISWGQSIISKLFSLLDIQRSYSNDVFEENQQHLDSKINRRDTWVFMTPSEKTLQLYLIEAKVGFKYLRFCSTYHLKIVMYRPPNVSIVSLYIDIT